MESRQLTCDSRRRPGTLTITVGGKSVTLDPLDEPKKFDACREKIDTMLAEVQRAK